MNATTRDPAHPPSEQELAAQKGAEALQRRQEVEDFKWLLAHVQGRRIATRLLERAGVHRTSFNASATAMAFNEGKRDIGLWALAEMLEANENAYVKLLREFVK